MTDIKTFLKDPEIQLLLNTNKISDVVKEAIQILDLTSVVKLLEKMYELGLPDDIGIAYRNVSTWCGTLDNPFHDCPSLLPFLRLVKDFLDYNNVIELDLIDDGLMTTDIFEHINSNELYNLIKKDNQYSCYLVVIECADGSKAYKDIVVRTDTNSNKSKIIDYLNSKSGWNHFLWAISGPFTGKYISTANFVKVIDIK